MPICKRFDERLTNNGKIRTFYYGVPLFDAFVRNFFNLENRDLNRRNLRSMLKISYAAIYVYLNWFQRNSLMKCVSQPKIAKKIIKTLFWRSRSSKVIEFSVDREPVYDFLLVFNTPCLKKQLKLFFAYLCQISTNFEHFGHKDNQDKKKCIHLPPHLIYVNALPCETQMLQIVTLRRVYLYQVAHLCIINSTESASWFNNFEVLYILCWKQQTIK